jgi:2-furoyl-CoA dehydrogenase large subunit
VKPTEDGSSFRFIGRDVRSKEIPRHVSGRGRFVDDSKVRGMAYAAILRSPYPHAKIKGMRTDAALNARGVLAVVTPDDIRQTTKPFKLGRYAAGLPVDIAEYAMAVDKVRYVGEPVAAVVAADAMKAEDALELIEVDYEPLEPVVDPIEAMSPEAALLFDECGSNVVVHRALVYGDVDAALREADMIVRGEYRVHRYSSTALEPFACLATFDSVSGEMSVLCNAQIPEVIHDGLKETLGVKAVRVTIADIGGAFGQKIHLIRKYVVIAGFLARKCGRPVKWVEDRSEHMMAGGHSCGQIFKAEAGVNKDGTVVGIRIAEIDDVGGAVSTASIHFTNKLSALVNTYRVKNVSLEGHSVVTNKCPVVPNRAIGKPALIFVWERMMDRIAERLKIDPIALRSINCIRRDEFPYLTPSGNMYDSGDYHKLLDTAQREFDFPRLRRMQADALKAGRYLGIGMAMAIEPGGRNAARDMSISSNKAVLAAGGINGAIVRIERDGNVTIVMSTPNAGQAHETTACQVAAEVLDIPIDQVRVAGPIFDSAVSAWGVASANSGQNFHLYDLGAVKGACEKLRDKMLMLASAVLKTPAEDLVVKDGVIWSRDPRRELMSAAELARLSYSNQTIIPDGMEPGLQATYFFRFPHKVPFMLPGENGRVQGQFTFSAGVHSALVEVDIETGHVKVLRYLVVGDCGTVIHPKVVDGMIYGAAAHGISAALGEGHFYDASGQLLTTTFTAYGKPTTRDSPHIDIIHEPCPSPISVFGQKAAGDGAAIPAPAAIASAVEDALKPLGVSVTELPLGPEAVTVLITRAQQQKKEPGRVS